jgi:hypothetical protein
VDVALAVRGDVVHERRVGKDAVKERGGGGALLERTSGGDA